MEEHLESRFTIWIRQPDKGPLLLPLLLRSMVLAARWMAGRILNSENWCSGSLGARTANRITLAWGTNLGGRPTGWGSDGKLVSIEVFDKTSNSGAALTCRKREISDPAGAIVWKRVAWLKRLNSWRTGGSGRCCSATLIATKAINPQAHMFHNSLCSRGFFIFKYDSFRQNRGRSNTHMQQLNSHEQSVWGFVAGKPTYSTTARARLYGPFLLFHQSLYRLLLRFLSSLPEYPELNISTAGTQTAGRVEDD